MSARASSATPPAIASTGPSAAQSDAERRAQYQSGTGTQVGGRDRADLHFDALKRMLDRTSPDYSA